LGEPRNAKLRHVVGYDTVVTAGGTTGTLHAASVNMVLFMNTTLCARSTHARLQHKDNKARGLGTSKHRQ